MNTQTLQNYTHNTLGIGLSLSLAYYGFLVGSQMALPAQEAAEQWQASRTSTEVQRELASTTPARIVDDIQNDMNQDDVEKIFAQNLSGAAKVQAKELAAHLMKLAEDNKFSPSLILSVIQAESSFRPQARSNIGALGLMQVRPGTAKYIAKKAGIQSYRKGADLRNPFVNLTVGVSYLSYLRTKFSNSIHYVAAYNLGPTTVNQMIREHRFELGKVNKYVSEIHYGSRELRKKFSKRSKFMVASSS